MPRPNAPLFKKGGIAFHEKSPTVLGPASDRHFA